jgi:hypothetical protein
MRALERDLLALIQNEYEPCLKLSRVRPVREFVFQQPPLFCHQQFVNFSDELEQYFRVLLNSRLLTEDFPAFFSFALHGTGIVSYPAKSVCPMPDGDAQAKQSNFDWK